MSLQPGSTKFNIKQALISIMTAHPFYGHLISTMNWKETDAIPTLATDGKNIYYNSDFFNNLPVRQRVFAVAHEIMHCVYQHLGNRLDKSRDPQYWNMAGDYAINYMLDQQGVGELRRDAQGNPEWLYDERFKDMTAEQIYKILEQEQHPKAPTLDVHIQFDPSGKPTDGNGNDIKIGVQGDSKDKSGQMPTQAEIEENMKKFKDKVIQAYQVSKMAGKLPGGLEYIIGDLLEPKINWRTLLNITVQGLFKNDRSFARPSRRRIDPYIILPSMIEDDTVDICVALDTSGSINDEAKREFLSEIVGILKFFKKFKLQIWCFDTQVTGYQSYDFENIEEVENFEFTGGGGTDISCNFDYMIENNIVPKQFICLTDAYNGPNWGPEEYCPCTWIIFGNPRPEVPFGVWTLYPEDDI